MSTSSSDKSTSSSDSDIARLRFWDGLDGDVGLSLLQRNTSLNASLAERNGSDSVKGSRVFLGDAFGETGTEAV